jgi:hypothetical protein
MAASKGFTEISRALTAAGLKMTPQSVREAVRAGRITPEPDGTFELETVVRQLAGNRKTLKTSDPDYESYDTGGQSGDSGPRLSYTAARTARELIDVQRKRLELETQRGNLLNKGKVLTAVEELASEFRDHWLQFSARNAGPLAAELGLDPATVGRVLDRYVINHARALPNASLNDRLGR